jgi:hypothetical protein
VLEVRMLRKYLGTSARGSGRRLKKSEPSENTVFRELSVVIKML